MYAVGDKDPTTWNSNECPAKGPEGFLCTWDLDEHDPVQHVAANLSGVIVEVWPVSPE